MNRITAVLKDTKVPSFAQMLEASLLVEPDGVAFTHDGQSLSRGRLLDQARAVSAGLRGAGLDPGQSVVVDVPHGLSLAIAMVGVVLAGGCTVPLDAATPPARREAIKADVGAQFTLLPSDAGLQIVESATPIQQHDPELLFVVYTSGSTGGPKGVKISHTNYVARMEQIVPPVREEPRGVDLCWTPASFIGMLDEVFFPLLCAKPSVIAAPDSRVDPVNFAKLVEAEQVTAFRTTPSLLNLLLTAGLGPRLQSVRDIYCSGEAISASLIAKVESTLSAQLWSFYGASEAPGVAYLKCDKDGVTKGDVFYTPQPFVAFRIVDPDGGQVPMGSTGEICVGGETVSVGYWNRPKLSGKKFYYDAGNRWYRTGDLGCLHADGTLEILGRIDLSERKINGTRISLKEVQSAIECLPCIKAAWISVMEPAGAGQQIQLVAHAKADPGVVLDPVRIMFKLAETLPSAARPVALLCHDEFPLTLNGKLDAQALLAAAAAHLEQERRTPKRFLDVAAVGSPESLECVLDVAQGLLETDDLAGHDNFFQAGGNSLSAVQFALILGERMGRDISSSHVFGANTFADIAHNIEKDVQIAPSSLRLLRAGTTKANPIFTINSTGSYAKLSNTLSPDISVHNLSIFGLSHALSERLDSFELEDIAERFANELIDLYPQGPWPLVAYCQDGCIAVETARVLQRRTGIAARLVLIDTFFTDHRMTLNMRLRGLSDLGIKQSFTRLSKRLRGAKGAKKPAPAWDKPGRSDGGKAHLDKRLLARFRDHYMTYEPAPLDAPATLIVSREWRHVNLRSVRHMAGANLIIHEIDGEHSTLFDAEHIETLGSALNQEFEFNTIAI